jgi:hypothetical protein
MNLFGNKRRVKPATGPVPTTPDQMTFGELDIEIHGLDNYTGKQKEKMLEACTKGKKVLNSQQFKDRILAAKLTETNGLSNLQIYNLICSGKDLYNESEDRDIDVFSTMYTKNFSSTVGFTYPNTWKTWINSKFFNRFYIWEIFGNVIHEALHNFGFGHLKAHATSVPYVIGYIARDLLKQSEKGQIILTPVLVAA